MLVVKLICKDCFKNKYGEQPAWAYSVFYRMTNVEKECEYCGKNDILIYTVEKDSSADINIKDVLK